MGVDLPDEAIAAAVQAVRDGATLRAVATELGVSHMTVARWVRLAGAKPRTGRPPTLTPEQKQRARARSAQGATTASIARELGSSTQAVDRAVDGPAPFAGTGPVAPPPPDVPALTTEELERDPLDVAREAHARVDAFVRRELAAGNADRAGSWLRQQNALLDNIRKIEEARRVDGADLVTFTPEQLAQGAQLVRERLEAEAEHRRAAGGMTCVVCGERLRLEFASAPAQPLQGKAT